MSDRPCNLQTWRAMQRTYGDRVELVRPGRFPPLKGYEDARPADVLLDGKLARSYMHLPDEAGCGAFGGECQC